MINRDDALSPRWFTSSYSDNQGGQCVETARVGNETARTMLVRDSKNRAGGVCEFSPESWRTFLNATTGR